MDSYATLEEANTYIATKLYADSWNNSDNTTKQNALYEATRRINNVPYINLPKDLPACIIDACSEEALALLDVGNDVHTQNQKLNITSISFGADSVSYKDAEKKPLYSDIAYNILRPYIDRSFRIV